MEPYDPNTIIGKPYRRGMLPYGGAVDSHGRIAIAVSEEQYHEDMQKLQSIV